MKEKDILLNAVMIEQIRSLDIDAFNELEDLARSLISSPGLDKTYFKVVCDFIEKSHEIDCTSDLFYTVFIHLIDPLHLFVTIRQKPYYRDKMIPFLMNHTGTSYFLVTERLAKVIHRFKNDIDFQAWIINISTSIYDRFNNPDC